MTHTSTRLIRRGKPSPVFPILPPPLAIHITRFYHSTNPVAVRRRHGGAMAGYGGGDGWQMAVEVVDDEDGAGIEEAALMEVMRRLEAEITGDGDAGGGLGWCRCPFVTINGNEESCGPSFSDSSSTVMASFDVAAAGVGGRSPAEVVAGGSWLVRAEGIFWPACGGDAAGDGGLDVGGESEEEWLERVLNCAGPGMEYEAVVGEGEEEEEEEEMVVAPCLW